MSKNRWLWLGALLCASQMAWSLSTSAQVASSQPSPPAQCSARRPAERFRNGVTAGIQAADKFFAASDVGRDPKKLKRKLNRVLDRLHDQVYQVITSDFADGRRCRVQGIADGFLYRLAALLGECVLDGAQWGQFTANLYCDLSIELGGLGSQDGFYRAPAGLCGTTFERVCDNVYAHVATEATTPLEPVVTRFLSSRSVTVVPYPGCMPYTEGDFASVFAAAVNLDCAY
jgi:hypothetical protein